MKMYELYSKPDTHCKNYIALNKDKQCVAETNPEAVQWCILGAALLCYPGLGNYRTALTSLETLLRTKEDIDTHIIDWNNAPKRTQEDIYNLCKEAGI